MNQPRLAALLCTLTTLSFACNPQDSTQTQCDSGKCDEGVPRISAPSLLINDVTLLSALEAKGFDLGTQLGLAPPGQCEHNDCFSVASELSESSTLYQTLASTIASDLDAITSVDSEAGVGFAHNHRLFDIDWLHSSTVRFRLVAITNRVDLAFNKPGTCGEVRFVYRLRYEGRAGPSRLPMTVMLVRNQPQIDGGCASVAQAWETHQGSTGALQDLLGNLENASSMELNLQAVRWPSGARENMGGHAEYLLRVFKVDGETLSVHKLPNTISLDLEPTQIESLKSWILDNLAEIDSGTAQVPQEFLASKAISVSPRGLSRMANRPFLQAFQRPEESFEDLDLTDLKLIKSPAGLIRRLDTMSCQGCHQSRGQAGFHIFGEEDADAPRSNAMEVGSSPHLNDELMWRQEQLSNVQNNVTSASPRPFAERDDSLPGIYGAHCGLGDISFDSWTCADGFQCMDINGEEVGMCVSDKRGSGDACQLSSVTLEEDSHKDRVTNVESTSCFTPSGSRARCTNFAGGFPNGHCGGSCGSLKKGQIADGVGDAICGEFAASGFNACLASGKNFTECTKNNGKTLRRRCDAFTPCGDDYVCAGIPGAPPGVGGCQPPYFIFQGRVDGHVP